MSWINQYKELLVNQGVKFFEYQGVLFHEYNQIIIPRGPLKVDKQPIVNANQVLSKLKGKLLWWSYYSDTLKDSDWYGVIKDKHFELSEYASSNLRNQIKKGINNFEIKQVKAEYIQQYGFEVYEKVQLYYFKNIIVNKELFFKKLEAFAKAKDIVELWGVFKNEELVGYCEINLYDKLEANISELKILPEYNKLYASYALFHTLSAEYLKNREFNYISDGYRTLLHNTGIQDFLIRKFGFYKLPLKLNVHIRFPLNFIIEILFLFRKLPFLPNSLQSVFKLVAVSKIKNPT